MTKHDPKEPKAFNDRFLRWPEVKERVGYSRSQVYLLINRGAFPSPIKLGGRASAWLESEVNEWIREKVTESRDHSNNNLGI